MQARSNPPTPEQFLGVAETYILILCFICDRFTRWQTGLIVWVHGELDFMLRSRAA